MLVPRLRGTLARVGFKAVPGGPGLGAQFASQNSIQDIGVKAFLMKPPWLPATGTCLHSSACDG